MPRGPGAPGRPGKTGSASGKPADYASKRSFPKTPEPPPTSPGNLDVATARPGTRFVVHQHHARRLHFDLRLEMDGGRGAVLVSWAVPKNLPRRKGKPHLAVHVEDHPYEYGSFSGTIPAGHYGAGEVRIFDEGSYELLEQAPGKLTFRLKGRRLMGVYHMVRTSEGEKEEWLTFLKEQERPAPEPPPPALPMLATSAPAPFDSPDWSFEPKWDGVRAMAVCDESTHLISRRGSDITDSYPELAGLHDRTVALDAVIDGEIVAFSGGRPSFEALQSRVNVRGPRDVQRVARSTPVVYVAFDLLYLDGVSCTGMPLHRRRQLLEEVCVESDSLKVTSAVVGDGVALFRAVEQQGLEGIVAKQLSSGYVPGKRSRAWIKVKVVRSAELVIAGWLGGGGGRSGRLGSLVLGAYESRDGALLYAGCVGTGFTEKTLAATGEALAAIASDASPLDAASMSADKRDLRDAHWVRPELVARVEFRELTSAGRLRAPSFKGIVAEGDPKDCVFDRLVEEAGGRRPQGKGR